jgi:hypothetical protein
VCGFQLLLGLASALFLGSESCGTYDCILFPKFFWHAQSGGPDSYLYFPQEQGSPVKLPYLLNPKM